MAENAHVRRPGPATTRPGRQIHLGHLAAVYLAFAVLCLFTSLFFSGTSNERAEDLGHEGLFGPIDVREDRSVYAVEIRNPSLANNSWTFVEAQLLDANREYLFSVGDELSLYRGYDGGEAWTERKDSYVAKLAIPEAGTYYLRVLIEPGGSSARPVRVTVRQLAGSSQPYLVAGIVALIIAVVLHEIQSRGMITRSVFRLLADD